MTQGSNELSVEQQLAEITGDFVSRVVALRGSLLRGGSQLKADMGVVLESPLNIAPASLLKRVTALTMPDGGKCRVLDFGCGNAPHKSLMQAAGHSWIGCDWAGSIDPSAVARSRTPVDGQVVKYNGLELPFDAEAFDLTWAWQSLEHVQNPEITLAELARCLRIGGVLAGSTSFLEPYHAQSTYGYSPWGFKLLCERHGLQLIAIQPADDALTLLVKKMALMLDIASDGAKLQNAVRKADIMRPFRDAFGPAESSVVAQICGTFRFIAQKQ